MVRPIMHDPMFLCQASEKATAADRTVVADLVDTLNAHRDGCVGMAANMIGVRKRIIAVMIGAMAVPMINPVILKKELPYEAEEGCLSLQGMRKTTRYHKIEVAFQDGEFHPRRMTFEGWTAQIIQHEVDHCDGVLI